MNRIKGTGLLLFLLAVLTACGSSGEEADEAGYGQSTESATTWTAGGSVIEGDIEKSTEPFVVDVSNIWPVKDTIDGTEEWEYDEKTDLYPSQYNEKFADADGVIYDLSDFLVRYFDKRTCTWEVLCDRPNCSHISEDCFAWFGGANGGQFYNGKLYTIEEIISGSTEGDTWQHQYSLYETNVDSMTREKVHTLVTVLRDADEPLTSGFHFLIHRGYLYYWYILTSSETNPHENGSNYIYRIPLDGKSESAECIYELKRNGKYANLFLKPYGNNIYFSDEEGDCWTGDIYRINTLEKQVEKIPIEGTAYNNEFWVEGDSLYYDSPEDIGKIKEFSLVDRSTKIIFDSDKETGKSIDGLCYDGDYWYIAHRSEEGAGYDWAVFDSEFHELGTIQNQDSDRQMDIKLFLRDVILIRGTDGSRQWIDKSKMTDGDFSVHE